MSEEKIVVKKKYYDYISVGKRTSQESYFVQQHDKNRLLNELQERFITKQTLIVVKNKRSADALVTFFKELSLTNALAIHGNHRASQIEEAALTFNNKELNILITTDRILETLALKNVELLINYDLPFEHTDYFKRLLLVDEIAESISLIDPEDENALASIEMMMKCEMTEKELEGFEHTPRANFSKKNRVKKPRHNKKKKVAKPDAES